MDAHEFFLQLFAILLGARIFAELAEVLKGSPVIGESLAGIGLGRVIICETQFLPRRFARSENLNWPIKYQPVSRSD